MKISNSFEKIERKIFNTNFKTTLASKYKMSNLKIARSTLPNNKNRRIK
jgi:hypothetical protein